MMVPDMGQGAKPPKCRVAPSVKHTGQESGGEMYEIFTFRSFLQSKSANNVCNLLQLL